MLHIKTGDASEHKIEFKKDGIYINDKPANTDIRKISENKFHLITGNRSVMVELIRKNASGKEMEILIDGKKRSVKITDEYDQLLSRLGMDNLNAPKVNQVKAPMPGLVLSIKVKEGDSVKKGDSILVLEAMKMENVIKAPVDAVIKKINVSEKTAVEKNQILIIFN